MKRTATLLIIAIFCSGFSPLLAQKANKKDQQFKEMIALIESGRYEFRVQTVLPTGGRTVNPSSTYTMVARDSTYTAYLPYFGRVYQPSYGGEGGVNFDAKAENFEMSLNDKKRMVHVKFRIQGMQQEKYDVSLSVGYSGFSSLNITSQKRQPISYSGIVSPLEEKD